MITEFPIDKYKGKTAIIFAHGPSAKEHLPKLVGVSNDKDNYCFISMGEIDKMQSNLRVKFGLDYWVMANHQMNIQNSYQRFNSIPGNTLVWADSVDTTPYSIVVRNINIPVIAYDQRHFNNSPCPNCPHGCRVIPGRKTIQETLQDYTKYHEHYGTGSTVALHATALGVLLGCKEVHIYGVDLSYTKGYIDGKTQWGASFDAEMDDIIKDFDIINKSAHNVGVKLVNFNKESPISQVIKTI